MGYDDATVARVVANGGPERVQAAAGAAGREDHAEGVRAGPPSADGEQISASVTQASPIQRR